MMERNLGDVVAPVRRPPERELGCDVCKTGLQIGTVPRPGAVSLIQDARFQPLAAVQTAQLDGDLVPVRNGVTPAAVARVTRTVRMVERHPDARLTLGRLAREAGLSPYRFLRTFESLTGVTPHQYILRTRLRHAATRPAVEPGIVLDIALDTGFGDASNFNRAFRTEFGVSPRMYRRQPRPLGSTGSSQLGIPHDVRRHGRTSGTRDFITESCSGVGRVLATRLRRCAPAVRSRS